jgi:hypothetical protein
MIPARRAVARGPRKLPHWSTTSQAPAPCPGAFYYPWRAGTAPEDGHAGGDVLGRPSPIFGGDSWQRERPFAARLRLASERLEEAQRERVWAVIEAHLSGLSIRQIAAATGLSSSRVHQLLGSEEAREIPRWLSQRRDEAAPTQVHRDLRARLAGEQDVLRRCRAWLERLERGDQVVVNLRPESDPETEYVAFDRPRVLRVLARIIADLDGLAGFPPIAEEDVKKGSVETRRARHRRRLAEPDPPAKPLTVQEERAALRALRMLPPSEKG